MQQSNTPLRRSSRLNKTATINARETLGTPYLEKLIAKKTFTKQLEKIMNSDISSSEEEYDDDDENIKELAKDFDNEEGINNKIIQSTIIKNSSIKKRDLNETSPVNPPLTSPVNPIQISINQINQTIKNTPTKRWRRS